MDANPPTPLFTAGYEVANVLASSGLLLKAWKETSLDFQNRKYHISEHDGIIYVVFRSFQEKEHFIVPDSPYGEVNIQTESDIFSHFKGDDDQPALVHQGAFRLFSSIINEEDFKMQMDPRSEISKPVIFIGHSIGGAVASLATLWRLENRKSAFCVTFGTPLFGDSRLSQAISRENWTGNFCHVVSKRDFVPHFFCATSDLICHPLKYLLPYWKGERRDLTDCVITEAIKPLINNILFRYNLLGEKPCIDSLTNALTDVMESPYRPFGSYIFCSRQGATSFENPDTIFRMLHLMIADPETALFENFHECIQEHMDYGTVLQKVMEKSKTGDIRLLPQSNLSYDAGISLQMEAIDIVPQLQGDHAWACLKKSGELEQKLARNIPKTSMYLIEAQRALYKLEWYKCLCRDFSGYYDCFKNQTAKRDIRAYQFKNQLDNTWDDIIKMWKMKELPSDFQTQNKYINSGNAYRRLVEPLDIADYYRKAGENGNYLLYGRPERYKVLEKWLHEKEMNRQSRGKVKTHNRTKLPIFTLDSCFWAHVEEALKDLKMWTKAENVKKIAEFEKYVETLLQEQTVSSEIFLKGSSFMQWWEQYKLIMGCEWKLESSLYHMIESHLEDQKESPTSSLSSLQ